MDFLDLETLFGRVLTAENAIIANDSQSNPLGEGLPLGRPAMYSFLGVPIKKAGVLIGMIGLTNRPSGYDEKFISTLDPFLSTCANIMMANKTALAKNEADQALQDNLRKMEEMNHELARSNEDLSQFAHIASHDLQAPLRHIGTYVDLIQQDLAESASEVVTEGLGIVSGSVIRMRSMIDDILTYASAGSREYSLALDNLTHIAKSATLTIAEDIKAAAAEISIEPMPDIICDGHQLKLVFQNVIQNAIKYRRADSVPIVTVTARQEGKIVNIVVEDNGIGILPDYRDIVFKMFQRLPGVNKVPGTGIGLAICKKVVERHGGKIWVEPSTEHGCRVCFSLPTQ